MEENLTQKKYIVYLTINKINRKIYIGVHGITSEKWDYYLGNGVYANKPSSYKKSKTPFEFAVNKYGPDNFERITLKTFDILQDALNFESELVDLDFIKRKDTYNIALGGGYPPSEEKKVIHKYDLNGLYICSYSSIREAAEDNNLKINNIGHYLKDGKPRRRGKFLWSFDKVEKLEIKPKTFPKKVGVYKDGVLIKVYPTIVSCQKDYRGCLYVLYGQREKYKGYTFKFE